MGLGLFVGRGRGWGWAEGGLGAAVSAGEEDDDGGEEGDLVEVVHEEAHHRVLADLREGLRGERIRLNWAEGEGRTCECEYRKPKRKQRESVNVVRVMEEPTWLSVRPMPQ